MNASYLLAGTVSTNPILFALGSLLVLAWKTAGWWGSRLLRIAPCRYAVAEHRNAARRSAAAGGGKGRGVVTDIHECLTVLCPFDQAPKAAVAYLDSLPLKDGKRVVPIRIEVGGMVVERTVDLQLEPVRADPGHEVMNIQWAPHDDAPYPFFRER